LRDCHTSRSFHCTETFRAVISHSSHDHGDREAAKFVRGTAKQNVHGGPVSVHARVVRKDGDAPKREFLDFHVSVARTDQDATRQQQIAGLRFLDLNGTGFIQPTGKHIGEPVGHVLDNQDRARKIAG
jgi:hypothetical protein